MDMVLFKRLRKAFSDFFEINRNEVGSDKDNGHLWLIGEPEFVGREARLRLTLYLKMPEGEKKARIKFQDRETVMAEVQKSLEKEFGAVEIDWLDELEEWPSVRKTDIKNKK